MFNKTIAAICGGFIGLSLLVSPALAQYDTPVTSYPAPWQPIGNPVSLTAGGTSTNVQLGWATLIPVPNAPMAVLVCNTGSATAFVKVGTAAVTAAVTDFQVQAGACPAIALGGNTYIAGITASGSTTLTISTGSGSVSTSAGSSGTTSAVTGTFWQTTQPVSAASLPLPSGAMSQTGGTVGLVSGSALVGKVGIDQTTSGTTNAVVLSPTSAVAAGIAPTVSSSLESGHILKASSGNLYSIYVTTASVSGYLMTFNSATVPADGAVTPVDCVYINAAPGTGSINYGDGPPNYYSTGISVAFSTTGCFTKTASATAFFKGRVQ